MGVFTKIAPKNAERGTSALDSPMLAVGQSLACPLWCDGFRVRRELESPQWTSKNSCACSWELGTPKEKSERGAFIARRLPKFHSQDVRS
jgi:hypothetical protein